MDLYRICRQAVSAIGDRVHPLDEGAPSWSRRSWSTKPRRESVRPSRSKERPATAKAITSTKTIIPRRQVADRVSCPCYIIFWSSTMRSLHDATMGHAHSADSLRAAAHDDGRAQAAARTPKLGAAPHHENHMTGTGTGIGNGIGTATNSKGDGLLFMGGRGSCFRLST